MLPGAVVFTLMLHTHLITAQQSHPVPLTPVFEEDNIF